MRASVDIRIGTRNGVELTGVGQLHWRLGPDIIRQEILQPCLVYRSAVKRTWIVYRYRVGRKVQRRKEIVDWQAIVVI